MSGTFSLSSGIYVAGNISSDYFFGPRPGQAVLYCVFSTLLLIAGVINCILLQPSKLFPVPKAEFWKKCIWAKVVLLLAMTPILNKAITAMGGDADCVRATQFYLIVAAVLVSCVAKQYRDRNSIKPPAPTES